MAKKASLRPLGDRVVVKPVPRDEKTASGIILPDTAREKPQEGEVVSVGPGRILDDGKREPIDVKVGDRVLHAKYAGTRWGCGHHRRITCLASSRAPRTVSRSACSNPSSLERAVRSVMCPSTKHMSRRGGA